VTGATGRGMDTLHRWTQHSPAPPVAILTIDVDCSTAAEPRAEDSCVNRYAGCYPDEVFHRVKYS